MNGATRESLYLFAFAFDLKPSKSDDPFFNSFKDLEKFFWDCYNDSVFRHLEVNDFIDNSSLPTGEGINYKNFAEVIWEAPEILGYSETIIVDDNNLYCTSCYGPNVVILNKHGEEIYREEADSYFWVDKLEIVDNTMYIYYWGSLTEEFDDGAPAVKELDITPFITENSCN